MGEAKNIGRIGAGVGFIGGFAYGIIAEKFSTFVNNGASLSSYSHCSTSHPCVGKENTPRTTSNTKAPESASNSRLEKDEQRTITVSLTNQSTLIKYL